MTEKLLYQLRIYFSTGFNNIYNSDSDNETKSLLNKLLNNHNASLVSQYDGFMGYVKEAEKYGIENYPLYHWTNDCLKDETKIEKYKNSYTIYRFKYLDIIIINFYKISIYLYYGKN